MIHPTVGVGAASLDQALVDRFQLALKMHIGEQSIKPVSCRPIRIEAKRDAAAFYLLPQKLRRLRAVEGVCLNGCVRNVRGIDAAKANQRGRAISIRQIDFQSVAIDDARDRAVCAVVAKTIIAAIAEYPCVIEQ